MLLSPAQASQLLLKPLLAPLPTGRAERVPGEGKTTCGSDCLVRHQGHSGSQDELRLPPFLPQSQTLSFRENFLGSLCTAAPRDSSASPSPQVEPTARGFPTKQVFPLLGGDPGLRLLRHGSSQGPKPRNNLPGRVAARGQCVTMSSCSPCR